MPPCSPDRFAAEMRTIPLITAVLLLTGCVKDRTFPSGDSGGGGTGSGITAGLLKVNEIVCTGSTNINEFGTAEDWFEIYNTRNAAVVLNAGEWFVSDAGPSQPFKYELPQLTIPANGHVVIWCDNQHNNPGASGQQVHVNFALSSAGEHIVIYYKAGSDEFVVDDYQYAAQSVGGASLGRSPDGSDNWILYSTPTPGAPNP